MVICTVESMQACDNHRSYFMLTLPKTTIACFIVLVSFHLTGLQRSLSLTCHVLQALAHLELGFLFTYCTINTCHCRFCQQ